MRPKLVRKPVKASPQTGLAGVSLQLRLTLFFAGFMVLVLILVGVLVYSLTRRSLVGAVEAQAISGV